MTASIGKFNGFPVVVLDYKDSKGVERKFSFGLVKAKLVLEHIDDIRVFVETQGGSK